MRLRTQVEWQAQSGRMRGCQCVKGCWLCGGGFAPATQEVGCVVEVECHRCHCLVLTGCAVLFALIVYFWSASGGRSTFLREWVSLRNRMVLLWVCSFPAQLPVHWVYKMHTSGSSCHTPITDMMGIFYLIDVFHVVYKVPSLAS